MLNTMENLEIIKQIYRLKEEKKEPVDPLVFDLNVLEDLSGIEGIQILAGSAQQVIENGEAVFREVKLRIPSGHEMYDRIIHPRTNYLVLTPKSIFKSTAPEAGQYHFRIITEKDGDERRVQWFRDSLISINEAKALFNQLLSQGMVPHRIDAKTGLASTEVMREFDAGAEEVIFMDMRAFVAG